MSLCFWVSISGISKISNTEIYLEEYVTDEGIDLLSILGDIVRIYREKKTRRDFYVECNSCCCLSSWRHAAMNVKYE